jgi:hypothetical protein
MHLPHINPHNPFSLTPQAQEVARKSGNERLVFWTSVVTLGVLGVTAATATAQLIYQMVRDGHRGRWEDGDRQDRSRGRG